MDILELILAFTALGCAVHFADMAFAAYVTKSRHNGNVLATIQLMAGDISNLSRMHRNDAKAIDANFRAILARLDRMEKSIDQIVLQVKKQHG